jgi:hypothetical protein
MRGMALLFVDRVTHHLAGPGLRECGGDTRRLIDGADAGWGAA